MPYGMYFNIIMPAMAYLWDFENQHAMHEDWHWNELADEKTSIVFQIFINLS